MRGLSLFSGAGIGEAYLSECGVTICTANELVEKRAVLYRKLYPSCNMICGDIMDDAVFEHVIQSSGEIDFLLASPPCQGMSVAGKNRCKEALIDDPRNHLIKRVFDTIKLLNPQYVLIENVPTLLKLLLPYNGDFLSIMDILDLEFGRSYCIDARIVNSADYGVAQNRCRAIIKLYKKNVKWPWPGIENKKVTVADAIGHLPSLEAGQASDIQWHFARNHSENHILWMKHTPTGQSAFDNAEYYPKKDDGTRIKGYNSSYRRIKWDEPAPTITIRSDAISSQRNVHPGRKMSDGTYSDARVLTPLELMLLTSLPCDWSIPEDTPEILIRQVIGESIPPLMIKKIVGTIK